MPHSHRFIICEPKKHWSVAIKRAWRSIGPRLSKRVLLEETPDFAYSWQLVNKSASAFLVIDATSIGCDALMEAFEELRHASPAVRFAVVGDRALADREAAFREAGAVHFSTNIRKAEELARIAARHFKAAPEPERTLEQKIWEELPWE